MDRAGASPARFTRSRGSLFKARTAETMQTRTLGSSDLDITPIGFGSWAIGGAGWEFGWGPQDDQAAVESIHRALDMGVNWIDTAAVYGLGHSEELVRRAVEG